MPRFEWETLHNTGLIMKKLLLTSIAALFLATGAAHAAETTKLPDAILGAWCGSWGWQFPDDDTAHLWRTDDVHDCANRGGIDIHPNSYDYVRFEVKISCKINSGSSRNRVGEFGV
jgi:hypothetical protein